jgi:hypothetical protein
LEGPDPAVADSGHLSGPIDAPQDLRGCFGVAFRASGCMAILYIIMFFAITCAALLSLFFFR